MHRSILGQLVFGAALWSCCMLAHADSASMCLTLQDSFSPDESLGQLLRVELAGFGVTFEGEGCLPITVETVSRDVAIVDIEGRPRRVVDLTSVDAELRPRSLALVIAEEINTLRVDRPPLRSIPNLDVPEPAVSASPAEETTPPPVVPTPPDDRSKGVRLLLGGLFGRAFGASQNLGLLEAGLHIPFGGSEGGLRIALEGGIGPTAAPPFADVTVVMAGAALGWAWPLWRHGRFGLSLVPRFAAGLAWMSVSLDDGAVANRESTATGYLRGSLGLLLSWRLSSDVGLEVTPYFGGVLVSSEVFGAGEVIAGVSGFWVAGRLGLTIQL